jgi:hypothetical protein
MYLLFLADPYSDNLGLKFSAERYLGGEHSEQNELNKWILANVPEATRKTAGAFISRAPAELVGHYCIRDLRDTKGLFDLLYPRIVEQGMQGAYEREQKLLPVLLDATRRGIRIDSVWKLPMPIWLRFSIVLWALLAATSLLRMLYLTLEAFRNGS